MPAERFLVTGATGFIGRHVASALAAEGARVAGVARTPPRGGDERLEWFGADLLAPGAAGAVVAAFRPDVLVHAAWYTRHGLFWAAAENEDWVRATVALAEVFRDAGGRRFVGIGSCAEYDWTLPGAAPWPETRALAPATAYGRAKCAAADRVSKVCAGTGVAFAWARLFHLFGRDEHPDRLVPSVALALLRGERAAIGSGRHVRDFCDSAYAGQAIAAVALATAEGAVNIGSGEPLSIGELTRLIGELCGRPDFVCLGARPDRPDDPPSMAPDLRRLREEVAFREPHDLSSRLAAAVDRLRRS